MKHLKMWMAKQARSAFSLACLLLFTIIALNLLGYDGARSMAFSSPNSPLPHLPPIEMRSSDLADISTTAHDTESSPRAGWATPLGVVMIVLGVALIAGGLVFARRRRNFKG